MTIIVPSNSLITQITGGSVHLSDRLNTLLGTMGLRRFRAAVSYVRWSGLGLIATNLEAFIEAGGEFQAIYGIGNGVTTPESFLYSLYLQELYSTHTFAGCVDDKYQNATFHPKFFEFQYDDKTVAIIGSANLTGGGLLTNTEFGVQLQVASNDILAREFGKAWTAIASVADQVTLERVRKLKEENKLGSELESEKAEPDAPKKSLLYVTKSVATKPLYLKVLDAPKKAAKKSLLPKLDSLTDKPQKLYLQILKYETGAQQSDGAAGYQIQLPVATLSVFFGVAPNKSQAVTFRFDSEVINVSVTHFTNNTHRVRIRPLRNIKRPAIVIFERAAMNDYQCSIVPASRYAKILSAKCTEQTRPGARRWGIS